MDQKLTLDGQPPDAKQAARSALFKVTMRHREFHEGQNEEKRKKKPKPFISPLDTEGKSGNLAGAKVAPQHVHGSDWREMLALTAAEFMTTTTAGQVKATSPFGETEALRIPKQNWIEQTFQKRECIKFIPSGKDPLKCGCGRSKNGHQEYVEKHVRKHQTSNTDDEEEPKENTKTEKWSIRKHTVAYPTDAHGTIEFQGGPHPYKAQYVRLGFDSDPADIMQLFESCWQIQPPKLIITVHGGTTNFDIQPKLARVFRKGLLKAARTTGAWIITSGVNAGVVRHVAAALDGQCSSARARCKVVSIGITPWGMLKNPEGFVGTDTAVDYHPHSFSPKGKFAVLNNRHSYYLLVDNGSVGRYGADVILRKRLESYIAQKQKLGGKGSRSVPVVCVVLEGGTFTIRAVLDYVSSIPRVPVVVCDGSGRASDMLAFAHKFVQEDGSLPEGVRPQLLKLVENVFGFTQKGAEDLVDALVMCAKQRNLMTVFRLGENQKQDVDYAILTALLKGTNLSAADQLALALAWNRVDIARSDIFVLGQEWPTAALHNAMMEALINDRVDFVRLLLENGVSMSSFLTMRRLEELYNTDKGPPNTLYYIVRDVVKIKSGYRYRLPHIGLAIEKLMGNAYKSPYTSNEFKDRYMEFRAKYREAFKKFHNVDEIPYASIGTGSLTGTTSSIGFTSAPMVVNGHGPPPVVNSQASGPVFSAASGNRTLSSHILWRSHLRRDNAMSVQQMRPPNLVDSHHAMVPDFDDEMSSSNGQPRKADFRYPFSELLLWAVLTKRQEMALCMWEHGEEAMAKALVGCKLYKSLAKEAAEDYLEVEICEELKEYAEQFRVLSLDLLDHCYKQDDAQTLQILTYELKHWGDETCLSLAVIANNKQFLAHPCCQILLADLWHGGLRIRSNSNLKVILGICFPVFLFALEFKSKEELAQQPQTAAEHEDGVNNYYASSISSSSSSDSSSSSSSDDDEYDTELEDGPNQRRRASNSSVQSLNLANFFHSRQKRSRRQQQNSADNKTLPDVVPPMPTKDHLEPHRRQSALSSHLRQNGYTRHDSYYYESRRQSVKIPENQNLEATKVGITAMGVRAMAQVPRMKSLNVRRKFYEFFSAPITTFWTWTLSFVVFMCCLSYSLLVRTPTYVSGVEWFLISYVMVLMIELIRKFMMSEPKTFRQKVIYFFSSFWNIETMAAIIVYLIGFGMRCKGWPAGRVILACDSVLWSIKLLDFMSIHPTLGPYITMAGKMVLKMCYIIALLVVTLLAFGLPRQSITYPNEEWHWLLIRNIFYKPYFMLYGEVYAPEIDTCGDDAWKNHLADGTNIDDSHQKICVPGHWVPPALMVFFMIVANLLLIAMLNATFTNIFEDTTKIAGHIWLFQRYRQVMEYEGTPFIPPPFTPIYYIWMTFKYLRLQKVGKKLGKNQRLFDFTLKLFLETAEVEKLHDFEEECMEDLAKDKDYKTNTSTEQRIHRAADRTDLLLVRVNDFAAKEQMLKNNIRDLESRVEKIEGMQNEVLDYVGQISNALPVILGALSQPQRPQSPYSSVGFNEEFERNGSIRITGPEGYDYVPNKEPLSPSYSNTLEPPMQVRQRHRTTTVNLGDVMATNLRTPNTLGHHGGSVLSLDPRSLSSRSTRDNDEYTSITDAIAASVRSKAKAKELQAKKTSQVEKDEYEAPPEITTNNVTMTTEDEEDDIDEMDLSEADEDEFLKAAGPRQRAASFFANRKS